VKGQGIADMMTDKATVEMESPVSGVVVELAGEVGDQVSIGAALVVIETDAVVSVAEVVARAAGCHTDPETAGNNMRQRIRESRKSLRQHPSRSAGGLNPASTEAPWRAQTPPPCRRRGAHALASPRSRPRAMISASTLPR
jgi:2-oxoisovalerate dehydrogenase E2 component (dihydrolipoyl transacylase)